MAQVTLPSAMGQPNGGAPTMREDFSMLQLKAEEVHELEQYRKLVQFRDQVVAGSHPRIKATHLLGKPASSLTAASSSQTSAAKLPANGNHRAMVNSQSFQANPQRLPLNSTTNLRSLGNLPVPPTGPAKQFALGKPEINPVLLEKSEDLRKAEMQLHRQRLERSLRDEQIEQRRAMRKAPVQASELADLDVADILERAMALVESPTAQRTDDAAANADASSDSFDDNTFYSSHHDTPSSQMLSRLPNDSGDEEMTDGSPYEPQLETAVQDPPASLPGQQSFEPQRNLPQNLTSQNNIGSSTPGSSIAFPQAAQIRHSGLSSEATSSSHPYHQLLPGCVLTSQESGTGSRSDDSGSSGKEHAADSRHLSSLNGRLIGHTQQSAGYCGSPVVRAHNLSPVAPQPSHIFPLAIAQRDLVSDLDIRRGAPAQVTALRKQHPAATSPDSSPQGSKAGKKKNKKKKRKADRLAVEVSAASPYIKPEPRSPSPLTAVLDTRPSKRQRQMPLPRLEADLDGSGYGPATSLDHSYQGRYPPRAQREERVIGYEEIDETGRRVIEPVLVDSQRHQRIYYEEPRSTTSARPGAPDSPHAYGTQYAPREVRSVRPTSQFVERPTGEPAPYSEFRSASRASIQPVVHRGRSLSPVEYERRVHAMPPPRAATTRIFVDTSGRKYMEPSRPTTVVREVALPEHRVGEPNRVYERGPPSRTVPRRPDFYEDEAMSFQSVSPAYAGPRRVVTQPEYPTSEHRAYRETPSYAMPPPGTPGEYISSRPRLESRVPVDLPREYVARAASVRPPMESEFGRRPVEEHFEYGPVRSASVRPSQPLRYVMPTGYEGRVGDELRQEHGSSRSASVRPVETVRYEMAREYGSRVGSVRPEMLAREYAVADHQAMIGRAYSVVPGQSDGRVYGRPLELDDDVVFLDQQPRALYRERR